MATTELSRRRMLTLTGGAAGAALAGCLGSAETTAQREVYVLPYHWGFTAFEADGQELDQIEIEAGTELTVHAVNDHVDMAELDDLPEPVAEQISEFDPIERTKERIEAGEISEPEDATVEELYEASHGGGHAHEDGGHEDEEEANHDEQEEDGHNEEEDGHNDDAEEDGHNEEEDGHTEEEGGHTEEEDGHTEEEGGHTEEEDGHTEEEGGHTEEEDGHNEEEDGHTEEGSDEEPLLDHGLMIDGSDISMEVPADMDEPVTASDVFDEPGTYTAQCIVYCGEMHDQQVKDLVVVTE